MAPGWTVETTAGNIEARDVLTAVNGYANGSAPALRRRLVPIGSYVIVTQPLTAADAAALLPRQRVAFDSKHFLYYWRLTSDRRALFRRPARLSRPSRTGTPRAPGVPRPR